MRKRQIKRSGKITWFAVSILVSLLFVSPAEALIQSRGGSNYNFWKIEGTGCSVSDREPFGVIKTYHLTNYVYSGYSGSPYNVTNTVNSQLSTMYANGQRRLRIMIYHRREAWPGELALNGNGVENYPNNGTVMPSNGGDLPYQYKANLQSLLTTAKNMGFQEAFIAFGPQGENNFYTSATGWNSYLNDLFQENWNVVYNLRPFIVASGMPYKIDLVNEGSPPGQFYALGNPSNNRMAEYVWRLWVNYNINFGKSDALVSSLPHGPYLENLIDTFEKTAYGWPYLMDLHIYDNPYSKFHELHNILYNHGFRNSDQGVVIGESYYNSSNSASNLNLAIGQTQRLVFFLTQWPVDNIASGCDVVTVPTQYQNYINYSF